MSQVNFTPPKEAETKVISAFEELVKALQKQGKPAEDKTAEDKTA